MATHLLRDCAHPHREGYALMRYDSTDSSEMVYVWNARNGVTPHGFTCPDTGTQLTHREWAVDMVKRDHIPNLGTLVWVNLLESVARKQVIVSVDWAWDDPEYLMREAFTSKESAVDILTAGMFPDPDCAPPTLMRVDADLLGRIEARNAGRV